MALYQSPLARRPEETGGGVGAPPLPVLLRVPRFVAGEGVCRPEPLSAAARQTVPTPPAPGHSAEELPAPGATATEPSAAVQGDDLPPYRPRRKTGRLLVCCMLVGAVAGFLYWRPQPSASELDQEPPALESAAEQPADISLHAEEQEAPPVPAPPEPPGLAGAPAPAGAAAGPATPTPAGPAARGGPRATRLAPFIVPMETGGAP